jgi:hypothetical protein
MLDAPIGVWRPRLIIAALAAIIIGTGFTQLPRQYEWMELVVGVPMMLLVYCAIVWKWAFNDADRTLFRRTRGGKTPPPDTPLVEEG